MDYLISRSSACKVSCVDQDVAFGDGMFHFIRPIMRVWDTDKSCVPRRLGVCSVHWFQCLNSLWWFEKIPSNGRTTGICFKNRFCSDIGSLPTFLHCQKFFHRGNISKTPVNFQFSLDVSNFFSRRILDLGSLGRIRIIFTHFLVPDLHTTRSKYFLFASPHFNSIDLL